MTDLEQRRIVVLRSEGKSYNAKSCTSVALHHAALFFCFRTDDVAGKIVNIKICSNIMNNDPCL